MGRFVIVVGPLYVDFTTRPTFPPTMMFHAELRPDDDEANNNSMRSSAGWKGAIGGSAWKVAKHWKLLHSCDEVVLITKLAKGWSQGQGVAAAILDRHFVDDAQWLRNQLQAENEHAQVRLEIRDASEQARVDYTFHLQSLAKESDWPIQTIRGGAARELCWQDVVAGWEHQRDDLGIQPQDEVLLLMCGIGRTGLLDDAKDKQFAELGGCQPQVIVDFGRSDVRVLEKEAQESVATLIASSEMAFVDRSTASKLRLLSQNSGDSGFPRRALVVRPSLTGPWWVYRRAEVKVHDPKSKGKLRSVTMLRRARLEPPAPAAVASSPGQPTADAGLPVPEAPRRPARFVDFVSQLDLKSDEWHSTPAASVLGEWASCRKRGEFQYPDDITSNELLREQLQAIEFLVRCDAIKQLLIYGRTGSGKEVVAKWLHYVLNDCISTSKSLPHVVVSAAGLPPTLVESALFGHERGAYTDATQSVEGALKRAGRGILQLDDLDTISLDVQTKLLRAVENKWFTPIGSKMEVKFEAFLICTTNRRLQRLVKQGKFREDLYYRLIKGGVYLELPPLDERLEDAQQFAEQEWQACNDELNESLGFPEDEFSKAALETKAWPGNFRQVGSFVRHRFFSKLLAKDGLPADVLKQPPAIAHNRKRSIAEQPTQDESPARNYTKAVRVFIDSLKGQGRQWPAATQDIDELIRWFLDRCEEYDRQRADRLKFKRQDVEKWLSEIGFAMHESPPDAVRDALKKRVDAKELWCPIPAGRGANYQRL